MKNYMRLWYERNKTFPSERNRSGAASELFACFVGLREGFDVFRAVSSSSGCDLIFVRGNRVFRVEVKTAYRNHNGSVYFPNRKDQHDKHDVLALVFPGEQVVEFRPPLKDLCPKPIGPNINEKD